MVKSAKQNAYSNINPSVVYGINDRQNSIEEPYKKCSESICK